MVAVSRYQGLGQFGPAYRSVYENDPHAPGSVDRVIQETMVRLCPETSEYLYTRFTPTRSRYRAGRRPGLERYAQDVIRGCRTTEERVAAIARFTRGLWDDLDVDLEDMRFGGTEEKIIERGSGWCTDVARVGAALCQVAGIPARLVVLADLRHAYSGHMILEAHRSEVWSAVDALTEVVYRHAAGPPASAWDLLNDPELIERHRRGESTPYTTSDQFTGVALSNYFVWQWKEYDYSLGRINDYYRSILEKANRGWPGGLRWLHGEGGQTGPPNSD